jgi:hypothetical protein
VTWFFLLLPEALGGGENSREGLPVHLVGDRANVRVGLCATGWDQLHHAIIGEDAEHGLHLRLEFILREWFEQHLFGVNVGQPSSPDGIVAL